jgi:hypothetical protein
MTWSQLLREPAKGRNNSAVVTEVAISSLHQLNEPYEDCLQAISNPVSYSTPKSYDSLLSSSSLPEQALAGQATLIAQDAPAQSHPDIITKG